MLRYIILELLSSRPLTGYEISKRFKSSLIFVWGAHHTQIYSSLRRLEQEGLVTSRLQVQHGKPNKRIYELTERGRKALLQWLQTPPDFYSVKDEMLLKSFAFDLIPAEQAAGLLRGQAEAHRRKLEYCGGLKADLERKYGPIQDGHDRTLLCRVLPLEHLIRYETAYVEWCEWAADLVETAPQNRRGHEGEGRASQIREELDRL